MANVAQNPVRELAERFDTYTAHLPCLVEDGDEKMLDCVKRILAEVAREYDPIDRSKVEPSADGFVHFADILKHDHKRRCDILIKCREIAEEALLASE